MKKARTKAFGYVRVSSKGQSKDKKDGIPRQKRTLEKYAKENNIDIVNIYIDDVSGCTNENERPAFNSMVNELLSDGIETIIIEDLSRLARKYILSEHLALYLISKNIDLISARNNENISDSFRGDPIKKLLLQMQGIINEYEKSNLVARLRKARDRKRELTGKCEGRKSYKEVDTETLIIIKKLRRKPRNIHNRRRTYKQIAQILNEKNIRTLTGNQFSGNLVGVIFNQLLK